MIDLTRRTSPAESLGSKMYDSLIINPMTPKELAVISIINTPFALFLKARIVSVLSIENADISIGMNELETF